MVQRSYKIQWAAGFGGVFFFYKFEIGKDAGNGYIESNVPKIFLFVLIDKESFLASSLSRCLDKDATRHPSFKEVDFSQRGQGMNPFKRIKCGFALAFQN